MSDRESEERNKEIVRAHFDEFVNRKNAAVIRKNMTEDFYDHNGPHDQPTGVAGDQSMMEAMYERYPDIQITIEDMVAEGDKVVCRNQWRATDKETGKRIEFHGFVLWRLENGKIAERWAMVTQPKAE